MIPAPITLLVLHTLFAQKAKFGKSAGLEGRNSKPQMSCILLVAGLCVCFFRHGVSSIPECWSDHTRIAHFVEDIE